MKYLKSYSKLFEAEVPTSVEVCASDISSSLKLLYEHVLGMVKERDLMGDALMLGENKNIKRFIKATSGVDYFISFENNEIIVTSKDNASTLEKLLNVADITKKPDNEAFMLYMDITERFGTLFDFICAIIAQL